MGAMKRMWFDWLENNREELEQQFMEQENIQQKLEEWTLDQFDSGCY